MKSTASRIKYVNVRVFLNRRQAIQCSGRSSATTTLPSRQRTAKARTHCGIAAATRQSQQESMNTLRQKTTVMNVRHTKGPITRAQGQRPRAQGPRSSIYYMWTPYIDHRIIISESYTKTKGFDVGSTYNKPEAYKLKCGVFRHLMWVSFFFLHE